jgi:hypothetical protein
MQPFEDLETDRKGSARRRGRTRKVDTRRRQRSTRRIRRVSTRITAVTGIGVSARYAGSASRKRLVGRLSQLRVRAYDQGR